LFVGHYSSITSWVLLLYELNCVSSNILLRMAKWHQPAFRRIFEIVFKRC
jgi:hypothetical protein